MLTLENLAHSYGQTQALKSLNLSFAGSGVIGFFGHNGSGKTTLFKILSGLLPCGEGRVRIFGHNGLDRRGFIARHIRKHCGVLLQETSSDAQLSVYDNLSYFATMMGMPNKQAKEAVQQTLKQAHLDDKAGARLKTFSHGMRRRLEIYRTFMHEPLLVFMDEPTAGLDVEEASRFLQFLADYKERKQALILFSTHNPRELEHCDDVIMLKDGICIAHNLAKNLQAELDHWHYDVELDAQGEVCAFSLRRADIGEAYQKRCLANEVRCV